MKRAAICWLSLLLAGSLLPAQTVSLPGPGPIQVAGGSAPAAPAYVKGNAAQDFSSTLTLATNPGTVSSGNLLLGCTYWDSVTQTSALSRVRAACVGGGSTDFTLLDNPTFNAGLAGDYYACFWAKADSTASCPVTATYSVATTKKLAVVEVSGQNATSPIDQHKCQNDQGYGNFSVTPSTTGNVTTTAANEFIFGWSFVNYQTPTADTGAGFTARNGVGPMLTESKSFAGPGAVAATFFSPSGWSESCIVTVKP